MKKIFLIAAFLVAVVFALVNVEPFQTLGMSEQSADDGACYMADIWSVNGAEKDGKVTISDMSVVMSNWKWERSPKDVVADIWGENGSPDGVVNIYDVSKVISCVKVK